VRQLLFDVFTRVEAARAMWRRVAEHSYESLLATSMAAARHHVSSHTRKDYLIGIVGLTRFRAQLLQKLLCEV
jgi:hypothetical protein